MATLSQLKYKVEVDQLQFMLPGSTEWQADNGKQRYLLACAEFRRACRLIRYEGLSSKAGAESVLKLCARLCTAPLTVTSYAGMRL